MSALDEIMSEYVAGELAKTFETLSLPVVTVKAGLCPVNAEVPPGYRR